MKWLSSLFGRTLEDRSLSRRITHERPLVIRKPKMGILNFSGQSARPLIEDDSTALKPLFANFLESDKDTPTCDVLMIYATIEANGNIQNASHNLREIIEAARAAIVVVATENDAPSYIAASKRPGLGRANLVMTLNRNGQAFPNFFKDLFGMMRRGVTMPMAWVKLAPQIPGMNQQNVPGTICAMEVTHILFD